MKCKQCGKENINNAKYCFYCGTDLSHELCDKKEDYSSAYNTLFSNLSTNGFQELEKREYILLDTFVKKKIEKSDYIIKFRYGGLVLSESGQEKIQELFEDLSITNKSQRLIVTLIIRISIATNVFTPIWRGKYQLTETILNKNLLKLLLSFIPEIGKQPKESSGLARLKTLDTKICTEIFLKLTKSQIKNFNSILDETDMGISYSKAQEFMDSINDWRPLITQTVYEYISSL